MPGNYTSTKIITLGSCAFRQWRATHSHCCKIHGYNLKAKFIIGCRTLDDKNWAYDFGNFKQIKSILEHQFDHTTCISEDDPEIEMFKQLNDKNIIDLRVMEDVGIERTAEWIFQRINPIIEDETNGRCWIEKIEVFEHENNSATYEWKNQ